MGGTNILYAIREGLRHTGGRDKHSVSMRHESSSPPALHALAESGVKSFKLFISCCARQSQPARSRGAVYRWLIAGRLFPRKSLSALCWYSPGIGAVSQAAGDSNGA